MHDKNYKWNMLFHVNIYYQSFCVWIECEVISATHGLTVQTLVVPLYALTVCVERGCMYDNLTSDWPLNAPETVLCVPSVSLSLRVHDFESWNLVISINSSLRLKFEVNADMSLPKFVPPMENLCRSTFFFWQREVQLFCAAHKSWWTFDTRDQVSIQSPTCV